jgi:hypothetical protein
MQVSSLKQRWAIFVFGFAMAPAFAPRALAGTVPSQKAVTDDRCWRLVAASDLILRGLVAAGSDRRAASEWVPVKHIISVTDVFKGAVSVGGTLEFHYVPADDRSVVASSPDELGGREVIAFLARGHEEPSKLFLARTYGTTSCLALAPPGDHQSAALAAEARDQAAIATRPPVPCTGARINRLIADLQRGRRQQKAIGELMRLGANDVPELVCHVADRTPLARQRMEVPRRGHFEAMSFHTPQVVGDVVATVLEVVTGEFFGSVANGGSDEMRARVASGWRVYLHKISADSGTAPANLPRQRGSFPNR